MPAEEQPARCGPVGAFGASRSEVAASGETADPTAAVGPDPDSWSRVVVEAQTKLVNGVRGLAKLEGVRLPAAGTAWVCAAGAARAGSELGEFAGAAAGDYRAHCRNALSGDPVADAGARRRLAHRPSARHPAYILHLAKRIPYALALPRPDSSFLTLALW